MFRGKGMRSASGVAALVLGTICAQPCLAAEDHRELQFGETRRAAFAGTAFRLELGRVAKAPTARLQVGMRSVSAGAQSSAATRTSHMPALEIGLGGRETGSLFIAGRPARQIEKKLGMLDTAETAMLVGAVVFVAVGLLVITNLNGLDDGEAD
nr:hypothetical protein [uncultured Sphingosinicella sp.]